mgnify:CR=1 FL=1
MIRRINNKGFTFVEIIVVLATITILALIAVSSFTGYIKNAKMEVCNANCLHLERMYHAYLEMENIKHSDGVFEEFLRVHGKGMCPECGKITYVEGKVRCSVHVRDDGDIPFL